MRNSVLFQSSHFEIQTWSNCLCIRGTAFSCTIKEVPGNLILFHVFPSSSSSSPYAFKINHLKNPPESSLLVNSTKCKLSQVHSSKIYINKLPNRSQWRRRSRRRKGSFFSVLKCIMVFNRPFIFWTSTSDPPSPKYTSDELRRVQ